MPSYHAVQANGWLGVLRDGYRVPFHHLPPVSLVPIELSSSAPGNSPCGRSPGGGQQNAPEGSCGNQAGGTRFLQPPLPCEESDRRMEACHRPLITKQLCHHYEVLDGNRSFSPGVSPPRGLDVLYGSPGSLFPDPGPSGVSPVSTLLPRGSCVLV